MREKARQYISHALQQRQTNAKAWPAMIKAAG
jgi:hypothetical protein